MAGFDGRRAARAAGDEHTTQRQGGAGAVIEGDYVGGGCTSGPATRRVLWLVLMGTADPEWSPAPDAAFSMPQTAADFARSSEKEMKQLRRVASNSGSRPYSRRHGCSAASGEEADGDVRERG